MIYYGWQEIADYLKCSVRQAQRYYRDFDLPVRYVGGSKPCAVGEDLTRWVREQPGETERSPG